VTFGLRPLHTPHRTKDAPPHRRTARVSSAVRARITLITVWEGQPPAVDDWLLPRDGVYAYHIVGVVETGNLEHPFELTVIRDWRDQIPADATFHAWEWKRRRW
jgi:hypothetical protein